LKCEDLSYDEDHGQYTCSPTLYLQSNQNQIEFWWRHIFTYDDFLGYEKEIKDILEGQDVACFSAYFDKKNTWIIDRIKSQKGMWSYFK
jgi:hypothetical protein